MNLFRFTLNSKGIYEELDKQVPRDSDLRSSKPDGTWLPKVGEKYPGAISFFTKAGLKQYADSGLKDWHYSVVEGKASMLLAERPDSPLYEDEFQVISHPSDFKIKKEFSFEYGGPRPALPRSLDSRPEFIRHHSSIVDQNFYAFYNGSDETFAKGASLGSDLGLVELGIHHETLAPGKRSSWPHAHLIEEEFVYVLEGTPDIWVNGKLHRAKANDIIFFPPNSNLAHAVYNNSKEDVVMIVIGEQNQKDDKIYYPEHPARNEECKEGGYFWADRPEAPEFTTHKNITEIEQKDAGGPDEPLHYFLKVRDLGRTLGAQRVALHHATLMPGHRSGIPHCESTEEEFVYVLKGKIEAWIDGHRYEMNPGDSCALPAGTGKLHTFINETNEEAEYLMIGQCWRDDNQCIYGINPELWEEDKPLHWKDWPKQEQGPESSIPKKRQ